MYAVVGATSRHSTSRQPNTPTACGDLLFFGFFVFRWFDNFFFLSFLFSLYSILYLSLPFDLFHFFVRAAFSLFFLC